MPTTLGTKLGTMLGTELADMVNPGTLPQFDQTKMYVATGYGAGHTYATATGGGEAGDAGGFGVLALTVVERLPTGAQSVVQRQPAGQGWSLAMDATAPGFVSAAAANGAGASVGNRLNTGLTLSANDVGRVLPIVLTHSGTTIGTMTHDGSLKRTAAIVGYTPAAAGIMQMGSGGSAVSLAPFATLTYRGVPSDAQLQAVLAAARTVGDFPGKAAAEALMPGTTVTHRWSLRDVLLAANVPVADGAAAPASIPDSVTNASVDAMAKVGSPVVRVVDPGSYPRTRYGVLGFSASSYLETALGIRGAAGGFVVSMIVIDTLVSGAVFNLAGTFGASAGWLIQKNAQAYYATVGSGSTTASSPNVHPAGASDVGRARHVVMRFDGSRVDLQVDGVLSGKSTTALAYATGGNAMRVGVLPDGSNPGTSQTIFALYGGNGTATDGQLAQHYADFVATGRLRPIAGLTNADGYDFTQDVTANGGPQNGVPAQVLDRVGTDHLTRVGTGLVVSQRTERLWSYETSPILYGVEGLTDADYYESAAGGIGDPGGFWVTAVVTPGATSTSATRTILSTLVGTPTRGWELRTTSVQTSLSVIFVDGTNVGRTSGSVVLGAAAFGKLIVATFVWDAANSRLRMYGNRAEVGTGTAVTGHAPGTGVVRFGRSRDAGLAAIDTRGYGFIMGAGVPSLANIQAQHDAILAADGAVRPMPGFAASMHVDVDADARANGGTVGATLLDRAGTNHLARVGAPSTGAQYARVFGF